MLLELLPVTDIQVGAEHALQGPIGAVLLESDALDPNVMPLGVQHAELVGKGARTGAARPARPVGGGGGIIGVDQFQPRVVGVGQGVVGIAQLAFPARGIIDYVFLEVQVEEAQGAAFAQLGQEVVRSRRRGRRHRCRHGAGGRPGDASQILERIPAGWLKADKHLEFRRFLGLQFQGDGVLPGRGEQNLPLGLDPARFLRDDLEAEKIGKIITNQL